MIELKIIKKTLNIFISIAILLLIWKGIILIGKYDNSLLPSPEKVLAGFKEMIEDGSMVENIKDSLIRFGIGYILAVISGIILGLFLGWFGKIWNIVNPIVQFLRPISPIAWFPFIVLILGIGDIPAIVIIFIAAFFPVLLSTVSSVSKVDVIYLKVAKNFGLKQISVIFKVILPAAFPYITIGLHIALGSAWVFLVAGEMVGAQSGLGFLIIDARNNLRPDLVIAGIILIGAIGFILDQIIKIFEKWIGKNWGIVLNERGV